MKKFQVDILRPVQNPESQRQKTEGSHMPAVLCLTIQIQRTYIVNGVYSHDQAGSVLCHMDIHQREEVVQRLRHLVGMIEIREKEIFKILPGIVPRSSGSHTAFRT